MGWHDADFQITDVTDAACERRGVRRFSIGGNGPVAFLELDAGCDGVIPELVRRAFSTPEARESIRRAFTLVPA